MTATLDGLCAAYDLLARRGWTQEEYINENGCLCVLAALRLAVGYHENDRFGNGWDMPAELSDLEHQEMEALEVDLTASLIANAGQVWDIDEYDLDELSVDAINDHVAESQDQISAWVEACIIAEAQSIDA